MNVILTGGAGFVGSHCVEYWLAKRPDWRITVYDSPGNNLKRLRHVMDGPHRNRLTAVSLDLSDPTSLDQCEQEPCDLFVNMASESHVQNSIDNPGKVWLNNTSLVYTALELARRLKPKTFIQVSTDEVYGAAVRGAEFKEWDPIVPSNPYSASKAAQEALCIAYWRTFGVPLVITNSMNMIGDRQHPEKFLPKLIGHLVRGEEVPIHWNSRTGLVGSRHYTHAKNYADAVLFLLERSNHQEGSFPQRWNITGDEEIDNLDLVKRVATILGTPPRYKMIDFSKDRPGHDLRYALDGSKIREAGWHAPFSLGESLRRTVLWYKENPEWI